MGRVRRPPTGSHQHGGGFNSPTVHHFLVIRNHEAAELSIKHFLAHSRTFLPVCFAVRCIASSSSLENRSEKTFLALFFGSRGRPGFVIIIYRNTEIVLDSSIMFSYYRKARGKFMANKRQSKEKRALILAALCEGTPMRAVARMFKTDKKRIARVIRETGEALTDYMDRNFRDLPCVRIEMDEQWHYVGAHGSRLIKPEAERGDFWLWCCIDADTKLIFSHKVGRRDWWTGNTFVEDVRNRVRAAGPDRNRQSQAIRFSHSTAFRI